MKLKIKNKDTKENLIEEGLVSNCVHLPFYAEQKNIFGITTLKLFKGNFEIKAQLKYFLKEFKLLDIKNSKDRKYDIYNKKINLYNITEYNKKLKKDTNEEMNKINMNNNNPHLSTRNSDGDITEDYDFGDSNENSKNPNKNLKDKLLRYINKNEKVLTEKLRSNSHYRNESIKNHIDNCKNVNLNYNNGDILNILNLEQFDKNSLIKKIKGLYKKLDTSKLNNSNNKLNSNLEWKDRSKIKDEKNGFLDKIFFFENKEFVRQNITDILSLSDIEGKEDGEYEEYEDLDKKENIFENNANPISENQTNLNKKKKHVNMKNKKKTNCTHTYKMNNQTKIICKLKLKNNFSNLTKNINNNNIDYINNNHTNSNSLNKNNIYDQNKIKKNTKNKIIKEKISTFYEKFAFNISSNNKTKLNPKTNKSISLNYFPHIDERTSKNLIKNLNLVLNKVKESKNDDIQDIMKQEFFELNIIKLPVSTKIYNKIYKNILYFKANNEYNEIPALNFDLTLKEEKNVLIFINFIITMEHIANFDFKLNINGKDEFNSAFNSKYKHIINENSINIQKFLPRNYKFKILYKTNKHETVNLANNEWDVLSITVITFDI